MTAVDRRPTALSRSLAAFAGVLALLMSGFYSWLGLSIGLVGLVVLAAGLLRGETPTVSVGAVGLFLGAVVTGAQGAPVLPVLAGVVLAVVSWDVGTNAITIGRQLGRSATTVRIELLHAGASLAIGTLTAGIGYGIYSFGASGQPVPAVVFLLLGAVLLIATLD